MKSDCVDSSWENYIKGEWEEMDIRRGDIFYINIPKDVNDPHKQAGCRPCIIVSNDMNNKYCSRVHYIPLTTSMTKAKLPTHVELMNTELQKKSIALCECVDSISKSFIKEKVGTVSEKDMVYIDYGIDVQLRQYMPSRIIINNPKIVCA